MQPPHAADERESVDTAVNIVTVEDREPLLKGESRFPKGADQRGQFRLRQKRPGRHGQRPQVQHGTIKPALPAGLHQRPQHFLARGEIETFVCIQADKLARSDDL